MKVEYKKPEFTPITLTIESQAELDALWIGMNTNLDNIRSQAHSVNASNEELDNAIGAYGKIWHCINNIQRHR